MMSQPHFYEGPRYSAAIEGMHPRKDEHQTFFDVEPVSHDRTLAKVLCTSLASILLCSLDCFTAS